MVEEQGIFDTSDEESLDELEPLTDEPYTYENMVNNPIVKPIAETDRSIRDIEDMIFKKLTDAKRDKQWVNAALLDVPSYQDSPFIGKLIKLTQSTDDVIKFQDIEIRNLKNCIKEMVKMIREMYGVRAEDEKTGQEKFVEPETKLPTDGYIGYLTKLTQSRHTNVKLLAEKIKALYDSNTTTQEDKQRFHEACSAVYKEESEKSKKDIAAKIIRMEQN